MLGKNQFSNADFRQYCINFKYFIFFLQDFLIYIIREKYSQIYRRQIYGNSIASIFFILLY